MPTTGASSPSPSRAAVFDAMAAPEHEGRPWKAAALWIVFLGPFFFIVYGFTNWFTSLRSDVPSLYFPWEQHLPFVPQLMLPYMSIDVFFAASVFVCTTRFELDRHAQRIIAAILISAAGFLLFPLQFSFARPAVDGFNGYLLALLTGFDKPFNQAPSLHISLLMLLWVIYARHLTAPWRHMLHLWFTLIALSVVLVYQHHFIDVATGVAAGMVCLYLLPDGERPLRFAGLTQNAVRRRLGIRYALGAAACVAMAVWWQNWAWLLLWPATALFIVAGAYLAFGVAVFQKQAGCHSVAARWLLAPYLLGSWFSYLMHTAARPAAVPVAADVFIGRLPRHSEARHWPAIVDLTAEFSARVGHGHYENIPLLDFVVPDAQTLRHAAQAIERARAAGPVLVHCALGASRSAVAVIAWMVNHGHARDIAEAERLLARQWRVVLSQAHRAALAEAVA